MVARDGIEPPTPAFPELHSTKVLESIAEVNPDSLA